MRRPDDDVIGTRPRVDLGPLFTPVSAAEAEAEIRRDFTAPEPVPDPDPDPAPAPRAKDETHAFAGASEAERAEWRERIKRDVEPDLLALALARARSPSVPKPGVTADDVHEIANRKRLHHLLGDSQRAWSWVGIWLAKLARDGRLVKYRRSGIPMKRGSIRPGAHSNLQVIYLHPYDQRARATA